MIAFRIDKEIKSKLIAKAKSLGLSLSSYIRMIIFKDILNKEFKVE